MLGVEDVGQLCLWEKWRGCAGAHASITAAKGAWLLMLSLYFGFGSLADLFPSKSAADFMWDPLGGEGSCGWGWAGRQVQ